MPELTQVSVWHKKNIVTGRVIDRIVFPDAKDELTLVTSGNTQAEKYLWFLQFNMESDVIRPLIEHIVTPLIDINNINNDIS